MRKQLPYAMIVLSSAMLFFTSCQKEANNSNNSVNTEPATVANNRLQNEAKKIYVNNVAQLYEVINDPDNVGGTVVLAPGTYLLSPNYPKGGLLELQHNMSLSGQPGHPESVVIDASNLPIESFTIPPDPQNPFNVETGAVRLGDGDNSVVWLTLQNDPGHYLRSLIQTDIIAGSTAKVRVANTIIKGSSIGINLINWKTYGNNRVLEAEIANNEISGAGFRFGAAIQIQNSQNVQGASIKANIIGNYLHGNKLGFSVFNGDLEAGGNNSITIMSRGDRIENNGVGISLQGGLLSASNNSILFKAYSDGIRNNMNVPAPFPHIIPGGVYIAAGSGNAISIPGTSNNNRVEAHFHDCFIAENIGNFQINAFGGRTTYPSPEPVGTYNTAKVYLYGVSANATVNAVNSFPMETAGTNKVNIFR